MRTLPALAALLVLAACSAGGAEHASATARAAQAPSHPVSGLPVIPLTVTHAGTAHRFRVEVAATGEEQAKGLMFRTAMGADEGMIFPMEPPRMAAFWMKNTVIPLDIIYIGKDRRILNIAENAVPYSEEPLLSNGQAAAVLELNGGRAAELGIGPGDAVAWQDMSRDCEITDIAGLEAVIGAPVEFLRRKILPRLDPLMMEFIRQSPLVFVSTSDSDGQVDISPKGDPAGFVQIDEEGNLLIPERPGNQLAIGFRNILGNGRIGLIFVVPNQRETLRVKGRATLRTDPGVLAAMQVNGKPALLFTHVEVSECFVHCGKALVRSNLWKPETWAPATRSIGGRQLASVVGARSEEEVAASAQRLEALYRDGLY